MPKKSDAARCVQLIMYIPKELKAALDAELHSEIEGRVPYGAYKTAFEPLLRRWVEARQTARKAITADLGDL